MDGNILSQIVVKGVLLDHACTTVQNNAFPALMAKLESIRHGAFVVATVPVYVHITQSIIKQFHVRMHALWMQ